MLVEDIHQALGDLAAYYRGRFSIPVGICFTLLFLGIVIYTLVKGRSFLMAGTWIALLVLLDMDYSMMSVQMALVFLIIYLLMQKGKEKRLKKAS